jgi:hypothetical protein
MLEGVTKNLTPGEEYWSTYRFATYGSGKQFTERSS